MAFLKSTLINTAKLGLAGSIICAVAWVVVVYEPDATIRDSEADILDLNFAKLSNSTRFARGLNYLGHDEPQTFDINGNMMYFSVNYSRKRPPQLMKEYQEEFVRQGLNEKVWDASSIDGRTDDMMLDAMTGGVVPMEVSREYAALGGVIPGNDARGDAELNAMAEQAGANKKDTTPGDIFKGHHYIEMFWDEQSRETAVTASWSDEHFDYGKMVDVGTESGSLSVDTEVPACPTCERISRVRDLDGARNYSSNIFSGTRSQADTFNFYRGAMARRGWSETDSSQTLAKTIPYIEFAGDQGRILQFSRGAEFLTILGFPNADGTTTFHTAITD